MKTDLLHCKVALDVLSEENNFGVKVEENKIANYSRNADELILTTHIAVSTLDSMHRTSVFILSELKYFIN
jgi:lactate dehydrogenase-like 2-hydroxyacid dehydrogenase